jgi:predicted SprT family Zn-dependent metalloprotease
MNTAQIKELASYCLDECGVTHLPFEVRFNNRLTAKVASAHLMNWNRGIITIASKWWEILNEDEKENTVVHEACHLAAAKLDHKRVLREGLAGHGQFWQSLHLKCGRQPERYCTRPRQEVAPNSMYNIQCSCGVVYKVTKTLITRRMNNNGCVGVCTKCKARLLPPAKYIKDMSEYQFNNNFGIWKGTKMYIDLVDIRING